MEEEKKSKKSKNFSAEEYVGLALKHRPKYLEDLVGQEVVVSQIKGMLKRRAVTQSFLIYGPYGSGKTSTARMLAQYLNCQDFDHKELRYCGECKSCKMFKEDGTAENHPSVLELNGANTRKIEDVRNLINSSKYVPQHNFRIYILDEIHQWTTEAKQAFLKELEEPPKHVIYILCTTDVEKLPDTIKSRTVKYAIKHLTDKDCGRLVLKIAEKEKINIDKKQALKIARAAQCHPRNAMQFLESIWNYQSDGKEFTEDLLEDIGSDLEMMNPFKIGSDLLMYIYKGVYPQALTYLQGVEDNQYHLLFKSLLEMHCEVIYNFFDKTKGTSLALKTPDSWKYKRIIQLVNANVQWYKRDSLLDMKKMTEILTDSVHKLTSFGEYPPRGVAVATLLGCTDLFFTTKKKHSEDSEKSKD